VTVVLYNKYIKLSCTNLYCTPFKSLPLPPPPGPPPPQIIHFLYTNLYAQKDALLNDPRHTPTTFYSFSLQYLGVAVCTVPTNCVGGGEGGAEIWLTGSGSEEVCSET
jgi:hypothetical protein